MRILGISGSLRRESHNARLLRAAAAQLPAGAELVVFDGLKDVAPFDVDDELAPGAGVLALRSAIAGADALLFATPEYNHSIPGQLKNAIDWASRPVAGPVLRGKPAAVVGASSGIFGAVWAQAELRKVLEAAGARVLDRELPVGSAYDAFDGDDELAVPEHRAAIAAILEELEAMVPLAVAA